MALHHVDNQSQPNSAFSSMPDQLPFHAQSVEGTLLNLESTLQGLSAEQVEQRLQAQSGKQQAEDEQLLPKQVFLAKFKRWISLLFLVAAGLSFYMGYPVDGILILVAWLVNTGVQGLIQWKAIRQPAASEGFDDVRCMVRRDGQTQTINASELVPGDIMMISGGQLIPVDARLISSYQLQTDESSLTGESVLVPKNANVVLHPAEDVIAQCNMLFAGTMVKTGKGEAIVTAMGDQTVMGRIASLARDTEKRESPFTHRLNVLSIRMTLAVAVLMLVTLGFGFYQGLSVPQLIQVGLVMAITGFPETVPGLAGLIFSMGLTRLQEKKVLVKNLHALEAINDVDVICTDKTGTLTENYLVLEQLFLPEMGAIAYDPEWQKGDQYPSVSVEEFLRVGRLNNGTVAEGLRSPLMGDPIDVALYRAAPSSLEAGYHARMRLPFDPVKLRSATLCEAPEGHTVSMIKGAPEAVLEICKYYLKPDGTIAEITLTQRSEFMFFNRKLAYENNLRIVGFAQKPMPAEGDTDPYNNAVFVGWVCLLDPSKPGVGEAVQALQAVGKRLIMITGDQKATAEVTARDLGIIRRNSEEVWLRSDLEAWQEPGIPDTVRVFARTKPEEKLAIVESYQQGGKVVAMVGDGVNDSPALQRSDVAIAMGVQGAEAAKDNADIILLNDRLEGILYALAESRVIRGKIQACIRYLVSCNLGLVLFIALATAVAALLKLESPVNVVQMLWLNLVIVSIPALVLAIEPVETQEVLPPAQTVMDEEETEERESFVDQYRQKEQEQQALEQQARQDEPMSPALMLYWASVMMLAGLGAYLLCALALKTGPDVARTAAFCTLALAQTFNLFNVQALNYGENRKNFMAELASTPITWVVVGVAVLLQALAVYLPGFNTVMGAVPLPWIAVPVPIGMAIASVLLTLKSLKA